MPTQVITARNYLRRATLLLPPDIRTAAEAAIVARPDAWPVIQGTGGARVIYFFSAAPSLVAFLDIYAANAQDDLTAADKPDIRAGIAEIREALRAAGRLA